MVDVTPEILRATLRRWTTGVTLVTAQHDGTIHGMTVSSFASVSLDPPLILVCLEMGTRTHQMVSEQGKFAVTLLGEDQQALSERFAGGIPDHRDRFQGLQVMHTSTGIPIPEAYLAYLECDVEAAHNAGTHTVFIGRVRECVLSDDGRPLLYYDRAYRRLMD